MRQWYQQIAPFPFQGHGSSSLLLIHIILLFYTLLPLSRMLLLVPPCFGAKARQVFPKTLWKNNHIRENSKFWRLSSFFGVWSPSVTDSFPSSATSLACPLTVTHTCSAPDKQFCCWGIWKWSKSNCSATCCAGLQHPWAPMRWHWSRSVAASPGQVLQPGFGWQMSFWVKKYLL